MWKRDFPFFIGECEKNWVRPWIWADYCWNHRDFLDWAPKSIVMSNWHFEHKDPEQRLYNSIKLAGDAMY